MKLSFLFVTYALNVRINDITIRSVNILQLSICVTRRIIPRGKVMTFKVFLKRACVLIRVRDRCILGERSTFLIRISGFLMRTRQEEANKTSRCGEFFEYQVDNLSLNDRVVYDPL